MKPFEGEEGAMVNQNYDGASQRSPGSAQTQPEG